MVESWSDELAGRELDQTAFSSAIEPVVKFAQFLLHPLSFVEPSRLRLGPFSAEQVLTFAKAPAFYDPIEKGLIKEFGLNRVEISPSFVTGLSSLPSARIAVILLTSSLVDLDTFSLNLTGVILSKDIVRVVLKTERECLLTSLGSDAFSIAIHEAPVLYRGMDGLATESDMPVTDLIGTREKALCYGYQVIAGFLRAQSPALSDLFYLRVPYPQDEWDDGRVLSEKQVNLLVSRFVKRGYPSWVSYTD